jgi:hypothetical protein
MAEGDGSVYNNFKEQVMEGIFNLASGGDTINVMLVTGHSLDIDNDTVYGDVSADEVTGTGYTAGGETLVGQDVTQDNANDRGVFDAGNVTWSSLTAGTPNYAIMYDDTPTTPNKPLIAAWELATATNGGDFTLQWHTDGILLLS